MDAENLFLQNLETIERLAHFVCRRNHVHDDEAAEFAAEVKFRLIENNYAIIRKFEGRSSFTTYLTTVITRLFYQRRVEEWGKWRPSAEAKRLGPKAITLEQLVTRDGYSFHEATEILTSRTGAGFTKAELEAIYVRLPPRQPRPVLVSDETSAEAVAAHAAADEPLLSQERERVARMAAATIDRVMQTLPAEDQIILRLRFWDARKVPEIAELLHLEQRKIYKRLDKLFAAMRQELTRAGVSRDAVDELLTHRDHEITVKPEFSPSHPKAGESREDGEGRLSR